MEQRLSLITLGVQDIARARAFYDQGLGWTPSAKFSSDAVVFYQLGGMVLSLYSRAALAGDAKIGDANPDSKAFSGITLAYNVRTKEAVQLTLNEAKAAGGTILKDAEDVFWGGHSGYFADPDGHVWEVAWNPHFPLDDTGAVLLPE